MPSGASVSARRLVGTLSASPAEVSIGVNENGAAALNSVELLPPPFGIGEFCAVADRVQAQFGVLRRGHPCRGFAPRGSTVVIGGKIVVEDHQPRTIDVEGLYREVRAFCAKSLTPEHQAQADFLRKIKPYVQAWYGTWHEAMLDQPFYRVNSRT